jgi:hypothetical protein
LDGFYQFLRTRVAVRIARIQVKFVSGAADLVSVMSQPPNSNGQYVRRVTLPSGRSIEVVYFESLRAESAGAASAEPVDELHMCPECDRDLVYPVDWEEASATHWEVELRCPNCEWSEVGTFDQATVDRFDERLDSGTEALVKDLRRLVQANMEAEAERFAAALDANAILPEDF